MITQTFRRTLAINLKGVSVDRVDYVVKIDLTDLEAQAWRALHNKSGKAKDGALTVEIVT